VKPTIKSKKEDKEENHRKKGTRETRKKKVRKVGRLCEGWVKELLSRAVQVSSVMSLYLISVALAKFSTI